MRKLLLSLACMAFMAGLVVAAEYTIVSYDKDKKVVTLKDGDKEVTGKITDNTKVTLIDKDGNKKEGKLENVEKLVSSDKAKGRKLNATIKEGVITEVEITRKK